VGKKKKSFEAMLSDHPEWNAKTFPVLKEVKR
jgi:hypothetical protein